MTFDPNDLDLDRWHMLLHKGNYGVTLHQCAEFGGHRTNFGQFDLNDLDLDLWCMRLRVGPHPCAEFRENRTIIGHFDL